MILACLWGGVTLGQRVPVSVGPVLAPPEPRMDAEKKQADTQPPQTSSVPTTTGPADQPPGVASTATMRNRSELSAQEHPWGAFLPKSWVHTQTTSWTTQAGQAAGARTLSVRESKTSLESVEPNGVTLKKTQTLTMGGKQVQTTPQIKRYDFYQELMEPGMTARQEGTGKLLINNLVIPCQKRVYEQKSDTERRTTTLWYTTQLYPYIFRAETALVALPTESEPVERVLRKSLMEVYESAALNVWGSREGLYRYRIKTTEGPITTMTEAIGSRYVPGGVTQETVREYNGKGVEIRVTETRLINFFRMSPDVAEPASLQPEETVWPRGPMPFRPRWRRFNPPPFSQPPLSPSYAFPPSYPAFPAAPPAG